MDEVDWAKDEVDDHERESLSAHEFEHFSSALSLNGKVDAGDEQIEKIVKGHRCHDNELRALRKGVGKP